jgi:hypothetical protein
MDAYPDLRTYFEAFPELSVRILGYVGKQAAMQLFEEEMQGKNDITVKAASRGSTGTPYGKSGRRLVTYAIGRGLKWVAVSSFPLNFYEDGRRGYVDKPRRKGIIRRKLASGLSGRLNTYIADAEKLIVDDWFQNRKKNNRDRKYGMGAISKL